MGRALHRCRADHAGAHLDVEVLRRQLPRAGRSDVRHAFGRLIRCGRHFRHDRRSHGSCSADRFREVERARNWTAWSSKRCAESRVSRRQPSRLTASESISQWPTACRDAKLVLNRIVSGEKQYHIVEIMACPGGCVAGGGQPYPPEGIHVLDPKLARIRAQALYAIDSSKSLRKSHENPAIARCTRSSSARPTVIAATSCCILTIIRPIREVCDESRRVRNGHRTAEHREGRCSEGASG